MPIIDIDFDIAGASAASWCEEAACTAADFGNEIGQGIVFETQVEQAKVEDLLVSFSTPTSEKWSKVEPV